MAETAAPAPVPAAPAITASDAGRTLAQVREARRQAASAPPVAATPETTTAAAEAPKEAPTDEVLALVRQERRLAQDRAQLERDRAALKDAQPDLDMVKAIKEAKTKGDRIAILRAVGFTDEDLYNGEQALFHQLLELAKGAPAAEAAPDVAALVAAELERREAERVAAMGTERQQARETRIAKSGAWQGELVGFANAHLTDYPAIAAYGQLDPASLINPDYYPPGHPWHDPKQEPGYVQQYLAHTKGRMPTHKEVLDAFEAQYREDAKKRLGGLATHLGYAEVHAPASASMNRQQDGSPAPVVGETLDAIKERRKLLLAGRK
jgi:hypothetical protein